MFCASHLFVPSMNIYPRSVYRPFSLLHECLQPHETPWAPSLDNVCAEPNPSDSRYLDGLHKNYARHQDFPRTAPKDMVSVTCNPHPPCCTSSISVGWRIGTDIDCARCRWVERTKKCENTHRTLHSTQYGAVITKTPMRYVANPLANPRGGWVGGCLDGSRDKRQLSSAGGE